MILKWCLFFLSLTIIIVSARIINEGDDVNLQRSACKCEQYNCGCCEHLKVKRVHLDDTVCANITYLPDDIGLSMTVTFDSYAVFNTTISARNPPPLCLGQDYIKELKAEICIRFYNLDANRHHLHGCLKFDVEFYKMKLASYDLGCFDVGPKNSTDITNSRRTWLERMLSRNQVPQVNMI